MAIINFFSKKEKKAEFIDLSEEDFEKIKLIIDNAGKIIEHWNRFFE